MPEDDGDELILEDNIYDDNDNDSEEDEDDGIDELEEMSDIEQELVLDGTAEVCKTVTKVHLNFFCFFFYNTLLIIG